MMCGKVWCVEAVNHICPHTYFSLSLCFSVAVPQAVTEFKLMNINTNISLTWVPPSERNGTFDYIIAYRARSNFSYPNYLDRIQEDSRDNIIVMGSSTSYFLTDVLAFANYEVSITAFNRLRGREQFYGPTVTSRILSEPQGQLDLFMYVIQLT